MSVETIITATEAAPLTLDAAYEHVETKALRAGPLGRVGLELEAHLVDLRTPARRVGWPRLSALVDGLPPLPSAVTLEPGGQVELSTPPLPDVAGAVAALQRDRAVVTAALREHGLGLAALGADPARPPRRVNPGPRYAAMERHFEAVGSGVAGATMMCSTAALQVNLEAGPAAGWAERVSLAHRLGPVLIAVSACSPLLVGRETGWCSSRQQAWAGIDPGRCAPLTGAGDPAREWAHYALCAPVMLVRGDLGDAEPVLTPVPFSAWADGRVPLGDRRPTTADLDYHLSTLFPPVRPRGFLELRYLDAVPSRWWPALVAIVSVLLDDPTAADTAAAACEPAAGAWTTAARDGLADPVLKAAAVRCLAAAEAAAPPGLRAQVAAYAEMVADGRSPGADLADRCRRAGPLAALAEEARNA